MIKRENEAIRPETQARRYARIALLQALREHRRAGGSRLSALTAVYEVHDEPEQT
jgi:hypothetical protein